MLFFKCIVKINVYLGADRLAGNIETMIGRKPPKYFIICWKFVTPLLLFIILMSQIIQWQGVWLDGYKYPDWAEVFGWMFAAASVIWIPGYAIYEIHRVEGLSLKQKIRLAWKPDNNRIKEIEERQMKEDQAIG